MVFRPFGYGFAGNLNLYYYDYHRPATIRTGACRPWNNAR